jgi:hypothetical protein
MKVDLRIRCLLWGCWCDEHSACPKCGSALYDADFIQIGKLGWMSRVRDLFKGIYCFTNRHCEVCGKRMWFTRHSPCCSDECYSQWIPF